MNKITQILIDDIGIGKHEAIVRAMNLSQEDFLKWANRCHGKVLDTIDFLDIPEITMDNYQMEFYYFIQEQTQEIKSQFSETLCKHIPEL